MDNSGQLPFDLALRRAIDARGLSLDRIAKRLAAAGTPVSPATLSNWQRGIATPKASVSLNAVAQLETILGLPAGTLASSLAPYTGVSRQTPTRQGFSALAVGKLRASFDGASDDVVAVRVDEYAFVRSRELQREVRMTVRAKHDGVDRTVIIGHPDAETGVHFEAGQACHLGATRRDGPSGLAAAELIFEARLTRGELYPISYRTTSPLPDSASYVTHGVRPELATYSLTVEFDQADAPRRVFHVWRQTSDSPHKVLGDLRLIANRWAHLCLHEPPPGVHGIRWDPPG